MKATLSRLRYSGLVLIAAIALALLSVYVERTGPELAQYGNLCGPAGMDPCYQPVLKGGFPIAYLFDAPGISRQGQLAFVEDELHVNALVANVAVVFVMLMAIAYAVTHRRSIWFNSTTK